MLYLIQCSGGQLTIPICIPVHLYCIIFWLRVLANYKNELNSLETTRRPRNNEVWGLDCFLCAQTDQIFVAPLSVSWNAKQSEFLRIQVRASSQTKGLQRG